MSQPATRRDDRFTTWSRRALTVPIYFILFGVSVALLPVLVLAGAVADAMRGGPWVLTRCAFFFPYYLVCELVGILIAGAIWLLPSSQETYLRRNFLLQCWWARILWAGGERCFGYRLQVKGLEEIGPGPILLFVRHASTADTLLPALLVSSRKGVVLRYVLKRELLWDPCLDIVGNRLQNCFVRRDSGQSDAEIAAVAQLVENLAAGSGVMIYPEGTRFTPEKQRRALARVRESGDAERIAAAERLQHLLPPRMGGPLVLLGNNEGADVVWCAHTGFEGARTFNDFLSGGLVNREIIVEFWRTPYDEIPRDVDAQRSWLQQQWQRVDEWVGEHQAA